MSKETNVDLFCAAIKLAGELYEPLKCSICLELITKPILLKCKHTFCGACLKNSQVKFCPLCRKTSIPRSRSKSYAAELLSEFLTDIDKQVKEYTNVNVFDDVNAIKAIQNHTKMKKIRNHLKLFGEEDSTERTPFDVLLSQSRKEGVVKPPVVTYKNVKKVNDYTHKHCDFENRENKDKVVKWLMDSQNDFDRITQTQQSTVDADESEKDVGVLKSVSQNVERHKYYRKLDEVKRRRDELRRFGSFSKRCQSLDVQVRNRTKGRLKRQSISCESPELEDIVMNKLQQQKVELIQKIEEECLKNFDDRNSRTNKTKVRKVENKQTERDDDKREKVATDAGWGIMKKLDGGDKKKKNRSMKPLKIRRGSSMKENLKGSHQINPDVTSAISSNAKVVEKSNPTANLFEIESFIEKHILHNQCSSDSEYSINIPEKCALAREPGVRDTGLENRLNKGFELAQSVATEKPLIENNFNFSENSAERQRLNNGNILKISDNDKEKNEVVESCEINQTEPSTSGIQFTTCYQKEDLRNNGVNCCNKTSKSVKFSNENRNRNNDEENAKKTQQSTEKNDAVKAVHNIPESDGETSNGIKQQEKNKELEKLDENNKRKLDENNSASTDEVPLSLSKKVRENLLGNISGSFSEDDNLPLKSIKEKILSHNNDSTSENDETTAKDTLKYITQTDKGFNSRVVVMLNRTSVNVLHENEVDQCTSEKQDGINYSSDSNDDEIFAIPTQKIPREQPEEIIKISKNVEKMHDVLMNTSFSSSLSDCMALREQIVEVQKHLENYEKSLHSNTFISRSRASGATSNTSSSCPDSWKIGELSQSISKNKSQGENNIAIDLHPHDGVKPVVRSHSGNGNSSTEEDITVFDGVTNMGEIEVALNRSDVLKVAYGFLRSEIEDEAGLKIANLILAKSREKNVETIENELQTESNSPEIGIQAELIMQKGGIKTKEVFVQTEVATHEQCMQTEVKTNDTFMQTDIETNEAMVQTETSTKETFVQTEVNTKEVNLQTEINIKAMELVETGVQTDEDEGFHISATEAFKTLIMTDASVQTEEKLTAEEELTPSFDGLDFNTQDFNKPSTVKENADSEETISQILKNLQNPRILNIRKTVSAPNVTLKQNETVKQLGLSNPEKTSEYNSKAKLNQAKKLQNVEKSIKRKISQDIISTIKSSLGSPNVFIFNCSPVVNGQTENRNIAKAQSSNDSTLSQMLNAVKSSGSKNVHNIEMFSSLNESKGAKVLEKSKSSSESNKFEKTTNSSGEILNTNTTPKMLDSKEVASKSSTFSKLKSFVNTTSPKNERKLDSIHPKKSSPNTIFVCDKNNYSSPTISTKAKINNSQQTKSFELPSTSNNASPRNVRNNSPVSSNSKNISPKSIFHQKNISVHKTAAIHQTSSPNEVKIKTVDVVDITEDTKSTSDESNLVISLENKNPRNKYKRIRSLDDSDSDLDSKKYKKNDNRFLRDDISIVFDSETQNVLDDVSSFGSSGINMEYIDQVWDKINNAIRDENKNEQEDESEVPAKRFKGDTQEILQTIKEESENIVPTKLVFKSKSPLKLATNQNANKSKCSVDDLIDSEVTENRRQDFFFGNKSTNDAISVSSQEIDPTPCSIERMINNELLNDFHTSFHKDSEDAFNEQFHVNDIPAQNIFDNTSKRVHEEEESQDIFMNAKESPNKINEPCHDFFSNTNGDNFFASAKTSDGLFSKGEVFMNAPEGSADLFSRSSTTLLFGTEKKLSGDVNKETRVNQSQDMFNTMKESEGLFNKPREIKSRLDVERVSQIDEAVAEFINDDDDELFEMVENPKHSEINVLQNIVINKSSEKKQPACSTNCLDVDKNQLNCKKNYSDKNVHNRKRNKENVTIVLDSDDDIFIQDFDVIEATPERPPPVSKLKASNSRKELFPPILEESLVIPPPAEFQDFFDVNDDDEILAKVDEAEISGERANSTVSEIQNCTVIENKKEICEEKENCSNNEKKNLSVKGQNPNAIEKDNLSEKTHPLLSSNDKKNWSVTKKLCFEQNRGSPKNAEDKLNRSNQSCRSVKKPSEQNSSGKNTYSSLLWSSKRKENCALKEKQNTIDIQNCSGTEKLSGCSTQQPLKTSTENENSENQYTDSALLSISPIKKEFPSKSVQLQPLPIPSKSKRTSSTPQSQKQMSIKRFMCRPKTPREQAEELFVLKPKKACIACSRLNKDQLIAISALTNKKLATYSTVFNSSVTHMIMNTDENKCIDYHTVKYVNAVAAGIWVLDFNWVLDSLAQNSLVPEQQYEVLDVSGIDGPRQARLHSKTRKLLDGFKIFCAPPFMCTALTDIESIILTLGGKIVKSAEELVPKNNNICLVIIETRSTQDFGVYESWLEKLGVVTVDMEWLSHCVGQFRLISFRNFALCSDNSFKNLGYPHELTAAAASLWSQQSQ